MGLGLEVLTDSGREVKEGENHQHEIVVDLSEIGPLQLIHCLRLNQTGIANTNRNADAVNDVAASMVLSD